MDPNSIMDLSGSALFGETQKLGLKLLSLMVMIDVAREAWKLVRGVHTDFVAIAGRAAIAAFVVVTIPHAAVGLANAMTGVSEALFSQGRVDLMKKAFGSALREFDCSPPRPLGGVAEALDKVPTAAKVMVPVLGAASAAVDTVNALSFFLSPSGMLLIIGQLIVYATLVVKYFVLDIMWPTMFAITVYMGVITVPITFAKEMGGLAHYARNVMAVALWPVVFSFLMILVTGAFPQLLTDVGNGEISKACMELAAPSDKAGSANSIMDILQFLALCIGVIYLMLQTPRIAAMAVGAGGEAASMGGMLAGVAGLSALKQAGSAVGKAVGKKGI